MVRKVGVKALWLQRLIRLGKKISAKKPLNIIYDDFMNTPAILERRVAAKLTDRKLIHFVSAGHRPPNYFQAIPGYIDLVTNINPSFSEYFEDIESLKKNMITNDNIDIVTISFSDNTMTYESLFFPPEVYHFDP